RGERVKGESLPLKGVNMIPPGQAAEIWLAALVPFIGVCVGVFIAVFGKALMRCPYQPDETKAFTSPRCRARTSGAS
ncbi:MAG: hypothetical protein ACRD68_10415, partial [Pyrinomonadaceae bacterium]